MGINNRSGGESACMHLQVGANMENYVLKKAQHTTGAGSDPGAQQRVEARVPWLRRWDARFYLTAIVAPVCTCPRRVRPFNCSPLGAFTTLP